MVGDSDLILLLVRHLPVPRTDQGAGGYIFWLAGVDL